MDKSVIVKSNKHGISLILDDSTSFNDLISKITEKFSQSKKFFGKCEMILSVSGRTLSNSEISRIIDVIQSETEIEIIMVAEDCEANDKLFINALDKLNSELGEASCEVVNGDVESGKSLTFKNTVLIIGDVKENAEVHTNGSIYVLGSLFGRAYAGELGNSKAKVFAADMCADSVMIYDNYFKMPKLVETKVEKSLFSKKVEEVKVKKSMLIYLEDSKLNYKILN